ncbi:hypothetical protein [Anaerovorax odorimutans]|uniref:hypothetical protein n=1 Tax=Anaerovorax odorimutans TaxID=109327 RepID=UPI000412F7A5|nr:hypothetical protein [Anaerovorax odorimutans]
MKKSFLTCILIVALILTTSVTALAADTVNGSVSESNSEEISITPYYVSVASVLASISFSGSKANATVYITPKSSLDYVKVNVKLMKSGSSSAIKSWTQKLEPRNSGNFAFAEKKSVSASGKYYVKAKVKCYKDNELVETFNVESKKLQYK